MSKNKVQKVINIYVACICIFLILSQPINIGVANGYLQMNIIPFRILNIINGEDVKSILLNSIVCLPIAILSCFVKESKRQIMSKFLLYAILFETIEGFCSIYLGQIGRVFDIDFIIIRFVVMFFIYCCSRHIPLIYKK